VDDYDGADNEEGFTVRLGSDKPLGGGLYSLDFHAPPLSV
jgi:hypothetical protein